VSQAIQIFTFLISPWTLMNRYFLIEDIILISSVWTICSNRIASIQVEFCEIKTEQVVESALQGLYACDLLITIRMTDREAADAVIEQWNGKFYPGTEGIPLQVRFADTPMQKSTLSCFSYLYPRAQKCYRSSSQLACKRIQLANPGPSIESLYGTLLR
jgi:hypothetical protein